MQGLTDRSRRPYRDAHQLPFQVETFILNVSIRYDAYFDNDLFEEIRKLNPDLKDPDHLEDSIPSLGSGESGGGDRDVVGMLTRTRSRKSRKYKTN